jgi:soluble lytic murein transglycosylase-like protein
LGLPEPQLLGNHAQPLGGNVLKKLAPALFAGVCCVAAVQTAAAAEPITTSTVLSPDDVKRYSDIFAAQKAGQFARADRLLKQVEDDALVGYVLEDRYLGAHYKSKFSELKDWLENYGDLAGADQIYKLAVKRAPKKTSVPAPLRAHWRGSSGEGVAFENMALQSHLAERVADQLRALVRDERPEAAHAAVKRLAAGKSGLSQGDLDRLELYVATAYLGTAKDKAALSLSEDIIARGGASAVQGHWTAGLAAYRLGQYDKAANHFEAVVQTSKAPRTYAAAAFWAARSWTRSGKPERVLTLYETAAAEADTFYGLLATRVLGRDMNAEFAEPALDPIAFSNLMQDKAAHRAVALWQVGHTENVEAELSRAFGQISPDLDPGFAALARNLGAPALELRAAETAAPSIKLTSLYPVPRYEPEGGYVVDQAFVLAIAKQESRFDPNALSKAGARGLMQIMPQTAVTLTHDSTLAGRNKARLDDPTYSMTLAQSYLRNLVEKQNGNLFSIAAAYNAGEGNLAKWQPLLDGDADPLLFIETIPLAETRDYVKRVMTNMWMYRLRLGEPTTGLDDAAAGAWPTYESAPAH